jgi:hypothetical protein
MITLVLLLGEFQFHSVNYQADALSVCGKVSIKLVLIFKNVWDKLSLEEYLCTPTPRPGFLIYGADDTGFLNVFVNISVRLLFSGSEVHRAEGVSSTNSCVYAGRRCRSVLFFYNTESEV